MLEACHPARFRPCLDVATVFSNAGLPELVFVEPMSCAWIAFDTICSFDGWGVLRRLAAGHGDSEIEVLVDGDRASLGLSTSWTADQYQRACDEELVGADVVRWAGTQWGIHGSRGAEIAVLGQRGTVQIPHVDRSSFLGIDAALRLARLAPADRGRMLDAYDEYSWDPASEAPGALSELAQVCDAVAADAIDPVVAIRALVDVLDRVPKPVRRCAATDRLHEAWTRTQYLLLGAARAGWGPLLLEQNDRNHEQLARQEAPLVRAACDELGRAIDLAMRT